MFEFTNEESLTQSKLLVIGVGGAGGNALDTMISARLRGVEFLALNTDMQALGKCKSPNKIRLGNGLGAGSVPEKGRAAAEESLEEIFKYMEGSDMIFLTAGMGGGTGTGASPIIAAKAKELGILTVGVVTKPFQFEAKARTRIAEEGILELKDHVDSLIVIPNQKLATLAGKHMTFKNAFRMADEVLLHAVQGISDIIVTPGMVNVDFEDVKTIMRGRGMAMMGVGVGKGDDRAKTAAESAICSPLLEDITIDGAKGILINITGPEEMTMSEVAEACELIEDHADDDALIIFGACFNESNDDEIKITVVATGFQDFEAGRKPLRRPEVNYDVPTNIRDKRAHIKQPIGEVIKTPLRKTLRPIPSFEEEHSQDFEEPAFMRKRLN